MRANLQDVDCRESIDGAVVRVNDHGVVPGMATAREEIISISRACGLQSDICCHVHGCCRDPKETTYLLWLSRVRGD